MALRTFRRRRRKGTGTMLALGAGAFLVWWLYPRDIQPEQVAPLPLSVPQRPTLTTDRPPDQPAPPSRPDVPERGDPQPGRLAATSTPPASPPAAAQVSALIESGKQAQTREDLVSARSYFSEALMRSTDETERGMLRAELTRIGMETILSARLFENDPLVERYVIQPGDSLGKIATRHKITAELLASINNIADVNRIRAGQAIKIIKGPFRAVVDSRRYLLEVYIGDTFVRHYPVGLGADDSTPRGEWKVTTKLVHPTYYPPRGGRIIPPHDPENPLGDHWIGLEGVAGEAVGQLRYGIHGTNEPESIGQSVSLGCVRLHNKDVAALYTYLVETHSTVLVR